MSTNYIVENGPLPSIHAEHSASRKFVRKNTHRPLIKNREKIDIVVIRLSRTGVVGYSRPCKNCITRLTHCDIAINNIYYSDVDGSIKVERFNTMFDSPLTMLSTGDRHSVWKRR